MPLMEHTLWGPILLFLFFIPSNYVFIFTIIPHVKVFALNISQLQIPFNPTFSYIPSFGFLDFPIFFYTNPSSILDFPIFILYFPIVAKAFLPVFESFSPMSRTWHAAAPSPLQPPWWRWVRRNRCAPEPEAAAAPR